MPGSLRKFAATVMTNLQRYQNRGYPLSADTSLWPFTSHQSPQLVPQLFPLPYLTSA